MASVAPVITFPDESGAWLEYLARVSRWTIGARCAAAQVVAVGEFDGASNTLISAEAIKGAVQGTSIVMDLPTQLGAGAPSRYPVPLDGDQILVFATESPRQDTWRPLDVPGAIVSSGTGQNPEEQAAVVRWYCSLPDDTTGRTNELVGAIGDERLDVRISAIRAIADEGRDAAVDALLAAASVGATEPTTATYAAVALWILGHRDSATEALEAIVRRVGAEQFFARWQVQRSQGEESATLYGPDPGA